MILYLDTSCIAKLFVQEPDSNSVRHVVQQADMILTSAISYVEMSSVVARHKREKILKREDLTRIWDVFLSDWNHYGKIPLDEPLLHQASQLVHRHPLRSLDALHLASALSMVPLVQAPLLFLTADKKLQAAAHKEKLLTTY